MWSSLLEIRQRTQQVQISNDDDTNFNCDIEFGNVDDISDDRLNTIRQEAVNILKYSFCDSHEASMLQIMQDYYDDVEDKKNPL